MQGERPLYWVGASLECLRSFPEEVIDKMGYALHLAQQGGKHPDAKPMKGFTGASVIEVVVDHDSNTWRIIYTLEIYRCSLRATCISEEIKAGN